MFCPCQRFGRLLTHTVCCAFGFLAVLPASAVALKPGDDVAAAVAAANAGDVIELAVGEYSIAAPITFSKGVTLRGVNRELVHLIAAAPNLTVVYLDHTDALVEGVTIRGASGTGYGAELYGGTLQDAIVRDNTNGDGGAGVWMNKKSGMTAVIRRTIFTRNKSTKGYGGGCRFKGGVLDNCLFYGNTATWGGGIYAEYGTTIAVNCTAYGNTATAGGAADYYFWGGKGCLTNCAFATSQVGTGTVIGEPNYRTANSGYGTKVDSFGLDADGVPQAGSPLIGAGVAVVNDRHLDGSPHDDPPTAGAYPVASKLYGGLAVTLQTPAAIEPGDAVTLSVSRGTLPAETPIELIVYGPEDFTKILDASSGEVSFTTSAAYGYYSVLVRATAGGVSYERCYCQLVRAASTTVYVDANSPTPTAPYSTWETASHSLPAAFSEATEGMRIVIADGEYPIEKTLVVDKELTIESKNGRDTTAIDAGNLCRIVQLNHPQAVVRGLTLRKGKGTGNGAGVQFLANGGLVEDCCIEQCAAEGCGGAAEMITGSVIRRTIIRNNSSGSNAYGGGIYFRTGSGVVENCLFYGNSAKYGGSVYVESGASPVIVNCTMGAYSVGHAEGGNLYNYSASGPCLTNNIIVKGASASIKGSALGPSANNLTKIDNPGFANLSNNDYTLTAGATTAIDQGVDVTTEDLMGVTRPIGEHVDIGCYEFNSDLFEIGFGASATDVAEGDSVTLTPSVTGVANPTCRWRTVNVADGAVTEQETTGTGEPGAWTVTFDRAGYYRVTLTVSSAKETKTATLERGVCVRRAGAYYVAAGATPQYPYDTWETALTNLAAAAAMIVGDSSISVGAGTWLLENAIVLDKPNMSVVGTARDDVRITTPDNSSFRVFELKHATARVSDVTVTAKMEPTYNSNGGGAYVSAGRMERCRFTGCTGGFAEGVKGVAAYLTGKGSSLSHSIVNGNTKGDLGCLTLTGMASVDNVLCYDNAARYAPGLYVIGCGFATNCTIVTSRSDQEVVGIESYGSTTVLSEFVNCAIKGSIAEWGPCHLVDGATTKNCAFPKRLSQQTEEVFAACGNVIDPLDFVNPAVDDYHLKRKAPSRGKGLYAPEMDGMTDLDGNRRAYAGSVDIGCYQQSARGFVLIVR